MTQAIIDGDVIAYMACESRYTRAITPDGTVLNQTDSQDTIDLFVQASKGVESAMTELDKRGSVKAAKLVTLVQLEPTAFTPEEDEIYMERAWVRMQEIYYSIIEACFADNAKMAVKGPTNFRDDIYPDYKANRTKAPDKRNYFVPRLRQRAVDAGIAVMADYMEADDLMRIWQEECVTREEGYVICSIDKDLRCMPGKHYDLKKNAFSTVTQPEATRFYYEQILKGDPTDNIKGIPRVGDVKAKAFLAPYTEEADYKQVVVNAYHAAFGDDWKKELTLNGRLIHLLRTHDDIFSIDGWPEPCEMPDAPPVSKASKQAAVVSTPKEVVFTPVGTVPIPTFNPNWGKKNAD